MYDYTFPRNLIAHAPASPRDSARLLVYEKSSGRMHEDTFLHIAKYLPENAVLVFNETKVIPARMHVQKKTGGRATLLYIETRGELLHVLSDRSLRVGSRLKLSARNFLTVSGQHQNTFAIKPSFPISKLHSVLQKYGMTPIPPYIKNSPLSEKQLREKYQTIFARKSGSVAAPTASLHFTKRLMKKLRGAGIEIHFITLHVNLGTFAPLTEAQITSGTLHKEYYEIAPRTAKMLNRAKVVQRPIIAVGTTVVRTLESASDSTGKLKKLSGTTDLFIRPGYRFTFIDSLVTNFHVPKSSLLMLVSAFAGREKIQELYAHAIEKKFRLFSFGDGMLIM